MALQLVLIAVLALGALGKAAQAARARLASKLLTGVLAGSLMLLALGEFLSLPGIVLAIDSSFAVGTGKVYNAFVMAGLCALLSFFILALRTSRRRSRIVLQVAVLVGVLLTLAVIMAATPIAEHGHTVSSPSITDTPVLLFYVVGGAYFTYAYSLCGWWTWRTATRATGALRTALRVTGAGLAGLTLCSIGRVAYVLDHYWSGSGSTLVNTINYQGTNISMLALVLGLFAAGALEAAPALHLWFVRRRRFRTLYPLWQVLTEAHPEIVLHPQGRRTRSYTGSTVYHRRIFEIRDGLVRLGPAIAAAAGGRDVTRGDPEEVAGWIWNATRVRAHARPVGSDRVAEEAVSVEVVSSVAVAIPSIPTLDADADHLQAVSISLAAHLPSRERGYE